ncbi:hypothetical protein CEXT_86171 [Caerostris extrusa]|uniref:Uncharacterized protein n=1 Tax=Caerostris extrusa TaxID=172846 RepID=A0AAV4WU09_CAEEX|nr:hypothetical protein CEXT_86171 [Caerostris extrusa]
MEWRGKVLDMGKTLKVDAIELSFTLVSVQEPFRSSSAFLVSVLSQPPSIDCKVAPDRKRRRNRTKSSLHSIVPQSDAHPYPPQALVFHREFKRGRGKGGSSLPWGGWGRGQCYWSVANLSPIDSLLVLLLSFLVCR